MHQSNFNSYLILGLHGERERERERGVEDFGWN